MKQSNPVVLKLLAVYYLLQGVLLVALGFGGFTLLGENQLRIIKQWLSVIHLDPENYYIHGLLTKMLPLQDHILEALSIGSLIYAVLVFAQGGGLLFKQRWASYLTVVVISSFIPWELYAIVNDFSPLKLITLAINVAIAGYLLVRELHARRAKNTRQGAALPQVS